MLRPAQHAGELDLAETRVVDDARRRFGELAFGVHHFCRRTRRVRRHDRLVAAARLELRAVGLGPTLFDVDPVVAQLAPVGLPPFVAVLGDGRQQEGEAGRRRIRVLGHELILELGLGQVVHRGRRLARGEGVFPVVDTHVADVHRGHAVVGVELQRLVDVDQRRRLVGREDVGFECLTQEGVVDAEHDVGGRLARGEHGLAHHRARILTLEQLDGDSGLRSELVEGAVGERERVVRYQSDRRALGVGALDGVGRDRRGGRLVEAPRARRRRRIATGGQRQRDDGDEQSDDERATNDHDFLRWHYPDQVQGSTAACRPLSPVPRAPRIRLRRRR